MKRKQPVYRFTVLVKLTPDPIAGRITPDMIRSDIMASLEDVWPYAIVAVTRARNAPAKSIYRKR